MSEWKIIEGDIVEALKQIPDNSVDAVLGDPPYGLEFMGKDWDAPWKSMADGFRRSENDADVGRDNVFGRLSARSPEYKAGVGFQLWCEQWAAELLRVIRPGGYAQLCGGSRTVHRLTCALEDVGFEIRDSIQYIYASGMPHSLQIDKAIDEHFGAERPVVGKRVLTGNAAISTKEKGGTYGVGVGSIPAKEINVTAPATPEAKRFEGWGTNLRPSYEPIVVAMKPVDKTFAKNALAHGVAGINIDGCRLDVTEARSRDGLTEGRWPPNVIFSHHEDCQAVGTRIVKGDDPDRGGGSRPNGFGDVGADSGDGAPNGQIYGDEVVDIYECVDGCPVAELDQQSGNRPTGKPTVGSKPTTLNTYGEFTYRSLTGGGDTGGASRFFFCSKASRAEREFGCEHLSARTGAKAVNRKEGSAGVNNPRAGAGRSAKQVRNIHPTVKPIKLAKWLATMLLPPKHDRPRRILVPFSGSGSEMIGCMRAGWDEIVGIQRTTSEDEAQYVVIARARLSRWAEVPMQMDEAEAVGEARAEKKKVLTGQVSLFDMPPTIVVAPPVAVSTPIVESTVVVESVAAASTPSIVVTPAIEMNPSVPLPTGEMAISELAQRLKEKGWDYSIVEIAQWAPERRAKAAKWALEQ